MTAKYIATLGPDEQPSAREIVTIVRRAEHGFFQCETEDRKLRLLVHRNKLKRLEAGQESKACP